ncbi:hypothetical protein BMS3Abin03_01985 [bacterium BMS3Abin03]|nr:hypothetical protein BMS3Abin03_01985 [bacterium BMS3Abin03]
MHNKKYKIFFLLAAFSISGISFAQVENVQLNHPVYTFLKEMKVKKVISYFSEDVPNISRFYVKALLDSVKRSYNELSSTERDLLKKYEIEFSDSLSNETTTRLFTPGKSFGSTLSDVFSNKVKYLYAYQEDNANVYIEGLGHFYHGQWLKHEVNNADLFNIGFRIRGTLFKHLGYLFSVIKGGVSGNKQLAETIEPRLKTNFKWVEAAENIGNYDFASGYLKYHTEPSEDMHLAIQLGREPLTVGYGYGSKLVLSGDSPMMDFIQFNFDYGIVHFSSIHASTVGIFSRNRNDRYTKYWAFNRLKITFNNLFDIGIGESIVYSGRGLELGYLTPVVFYKFVEMSLQDRDNGNLYFDLQTNFIKNLELQATFFLDENILSHLDNLNLYTNKTAYQLGAFWYEAFTVENLSLIFEYTRIRPYVYTHFNIQNTYSAWGTNMGHRIGPNADEIFTKLAYNVNDWIRFSMEYRHQRSGENIYDADGNLVRNVGGDIFLTHGGNPVNKEAFFLDGIRINNDIFQAGFRIEPVRDFIFDIIYNYSIEDHITEGFKQDYSYGLIKFTLEY